MINWIMCTLGYVRCGICNKWTAPSINFGNVCSFKCLDHRMTELNLCLVSQGFGKILK